MSILTPKPTFIYFDVGNVLLHWEQSLHLFAQETGKTFEQVKQAHTRHGARAGRGEIDFLEFWRLIKKDLDIAHHPSSEVHEYTVNTYTPILPMHTLLQKAKQSYRVGLLTNMEPDTLPMIRARRLIPDIPYDAIIDSSVVGSVKPEVKIYELAQKTAKVPAQDIFFIDDTADNIAMARSCGWGGYVFDHRHPETSANELSQLLKLF